ncbi:chorismate mutase [Streptomyces viridochromogenes]|uniref:chorismate mutase n=1 Tax=Streptomyces viridochromogenes TaxID=1938 RepID=A0A0J7Z2U9_STRVR|nr:chorismate mutase [Streptomyces viridochromogenes]KMS70361.1 chorismate mutase [Streptomyces viridochromogenes]KOG17117.1 chorismate mutase [Streptomyces viridochromogenes]KOG20138.1 chorismate mutase [Streptomyces viridochromogenes]
MHSRRLRSALVAVCAAAAVSLAGAAPAAAHSATPPATHASTPVRAASVSPGLTPLTDLFAERLLLADKVAAAKYGTDKPIDDPVRERQILDDVAVRAAGLGLDPDGVKAVFRDQIEANKLVQRGLYARWDAHPEERPTERPDLVKEVRPQLDRITTELLDALRDTRRPRTSPACEPRLVVAAVRSAYGHELDALHVEGLVRALPSVCADS